MLRQLHNRILGRMILYVIVPTVLIFAVALTLTTRSSLINLRQAAEQQLQLRANLVALQVEDQNSSAVLSAQRMAEAQVAGMFGNREASIAYAKTVLENFGSITGAYFGYEPNADGKDAESLGKLPAEAMDPAGRFIPYWFVTNGGQRTIELEPLVNMETSLYYQGVKEAFEKSKTAAPKVTEPYVYQGKMITEQVYPIIIDGQFKGVAGVDFALADIEARLSKSAEQSEVEIFLFSSQGNLIADTSDIDTTPDSTASMLRSGNLADVQEASLFRELVDRRNSRKPILEVDPNDGVRYYFAVAPVPTGDWTVVVRKPESLVTGPIWSQAIYRLSTIAVALAFVIGLLIAMSARLARRIGSAATIAREVADGNLEVEIPPAKGADETGILLRSIKTMTCNLNQLIGNVKHASIQLNSTATQLSAMSRQQSETASSFGASSNQIAAATKEISATTAELVNTMSDVHEVAVGTAQVAASGRESLIEMEANMRSLDRATGSIGEKLAVINEKASNITGIVTTITKVADQTNLLSVNAAIEAEKAGEYGVGFLVVAREIRRLADQTATATLDIEQMVSQMQSAVSAGVMEMDRFTDQVRRNVADVAQISQQMSVIIDKVNASAEKFEQVNEGMQSQAEGADQISQAMSQLTTHAKQNTEAIAEYTRAAEDLKAAIDSLKSAIASFKLKS